MLVFTCIPQHISVLTRFALGRMDLATELAIKQRKVNAEAKAKEEQREKEERETEARKMAARRRRQEQKEMASDDED